MNDRVLATAVVAVVCAAGFASQWETVDRFLSTVFSWLLLGGGGVLLVVVLVREAWEAWLDWHWMGPPGWWPRQEREPEGEREESSR